MIDRHEFSLRHAVDVDVGADAIFDALGFEVGLDFEDFGIGFHGKSERVRRSRPRAVVVPAARDGQVR